MAKITQFDRTNLKALRADIDRAVNDALGKYGLTAELGNISFTATDFNAKIKVSCGSSEDAARREFEKYAPRFGLDPDDFGTSFRQGGTIFTVVGIKPKSHKYPVLAANKRGTVYKFAASDVK